MPLITPWLSHKVKVHAVDQSCGHGQHDLMLYVCTESWGQAMACCGRAVVPGRGCQAVLCPPARTFEWVVLNWCCIISDLNANDLTTLHLAPHEHRIKVISLVTQGSHTTIRVINMANSDLRAQCLIKCLLKKSPHARDGQHPTSWKMEWVPNPHILVCTELKLWHEGYVPALPPKN